MTKRFWGTGSVPRISPVLKMESEVIVLLSGGVDSTACVHFYKEMGRPTGAFFIDYGQAAALHEYDAAEKVAKYYSIPLKNFRWHGANPKTAGLILGRNCFLFAAALMECSASALVIASGIHVAPEYPDCNEIFMNRMQAVLELYQERNLQISAPFLSWNKGDIYAYCRERGVPFELTYSCENGEAHPCGICFSCKDREMFYACP